MRRRCRQAAIQVCVVALVGTVAASASAAVRQPGHGRFHIPSRARQLIVVSSPTYDPSNHLATLRAYRRSSAGSPWRLHFGPWPAEIGAGGLRNHRREGDGSTPTGVYGLQTLLYGNRPNPGGLHLRYHQLVCGDWWDEDPYSSRYNQFVHVACGTHPAFAPGSEALWTETVAYPYFAVLRFNVDPVRGGAGAPGSGIFLHAWVGGPTAGCVALPVARLLDVLRWIRPSRDPKVAIGTTAQLF